MKRQLDTQNHLYRRGVHHLRLLVVGLVRRLRVAAVEAEGNDHEEGAHEPQREKDETAAEDTDKPEDRTADRPRLRGWGALLDASFGVNAAAVRDDEDDAGPAEADQQKEFNDPHATIHLTHVVSFVVTRLHLVVVYLGITGACSDSAPTLPVVPLATTERIALAECEAVPLTNMFGIIVLAGPACGSGELAAAKNHDKQEPAEEEQPAAAAAAASHHLFYEAP